MGTVFVEKKATSVAGAPVTIITVDANAVYATLTIELFYDVTDGSQTDAKGHIYVSNSDTPTDQDKVAFVVLEPNGSYVQECSLMGPNSKFIIKFDSAKVRARVAGLKAVADVPA